MRRRDLLTSTSLLVAATMIPTRGILAGASDDPFAGIDEFVEGAMQEGHVPGLAACITDRERVVWSRGYGWSDMENRVPMTIHRIQNIGSISKTITATAVMQLEELGLLDLDQDVSEYLGITLRNPNHPEVPITTRQLMIHTASLRDGSAYVRHYACGDPRMSLDAWIRAFFTPTGAFYNAGENFQPWAAGSTWEYCNMAFGVLGLIVEKVSGLPFDQYCTRNIFVPLGMSSTSWMIADLDPEQFSHPYSWVEEGVVRGSSWGDVKLGIITPDGPSQDRELSDGYHANCFYNHANYPDGFLRTSVSDLSRYLRAYLNDGLFEGTRVLRSETVQRMFTPQRLPAAEDGKRTYGLTWYAQHAIEGQLAWGHGGGDPGIGTGVICLRESGIGMIVFTNTARSPAPWAVLEKLSNIALDL